MAFRRLSGVRRINMPKPDTNDGTQNATNIDNFLFKLEQYFDAIDVQNNALKVGTILIFLRGAA